MTVYFGCSPNFGSPNGESQNVNSLLKGYSPNRSGPRQWSDLGLIKVTTKL